MLLASISSPPLLFLLSSAIYAFLRLLPSGPFHTTSQVGKQDLRRHGTHFMSTMVIVHIDPNYYALPTLHHTISAFCTQHIPPNAMHTPSPSLPLDDPTGIPTSTIYNHLYTFLCVFLLWLPSYQFIISPLQGLLLSFGFHPFGVPPFPPLSPRLRNIFSQPRRYTISLLYMVYACAGALCYLI
jgi:hypothetical protein